MPKEFFGLSLLSEGAITASWNAAQGTDFKQGNKNALFSLVVKAKTDVTLSRALSLNSRYTAAEAYTKQAELLDVDLQFQQLDGSNNVANEFALYQNTPNPFDGATTIGFHLPQAGEATLTFFDTDGKVLKTIIGDYAKGYNVIAVSANDLGNVGSKLIYYQLRTATATATRKAIIE